MNPQNPCIEFLFPAESKDFADSILMIQKSEVADIDPEILKALVVTREELQALFKIATRLAATQTACPMRIWAEEQGGLGKWRVMLLPEPADADPLPDEPPT
jgi:hypothetical protein